MGMDNFSLYAGDVRDIEDLDECLERLGDIDIIYHLAAINGTKWFHEAAHSVIDVNINGTLRCLEVAMAHDSRFVFASSPEAFGEAEVQPLTDGNPMVSPTLQSTKDIHRGKQILGRGCMSACG